MKKNCFSYIALALIHNKPLFLGQTSAIDAAEDLCKADGRECYIRVCKGSRAVDFLAFNNAAGKAVAIL